MDSISVNECVSERVEPTESLCPVCLERIPARRVFRSEAVVLEKDCPRHGSYRTKIWQGQPAMESWRSNKVLPALPVGSRQSVYGCPFDCGICTRHSQYGCTVVMEVTQSCNLNCHVCFASAGCSQQDPSLKQIEAWYRLAKETEDNCIIQISGGEPTLRDDLPEIISLGRRMGFPFIQLNTNGIRLANDTSLVKKLSAAGLSSVFLQFDGTEDAIYYAIRGKGLLSYKHAAIQACADHGIGVVLVATLVPGINTHNIGAILDFALRAIPSIQGVHFQPAGYLGRYPQPPSDDKRLTLPELMQAIELQTQGRFKAADFQPPNCEHERCSFHGNFVVPKDGKPKAVSRRGVDAGCCTPGPDHSSNVDRAVSIVTKQWSGKKRALLEIVNAPNDGVGCCSVQEGEQQRIYDLDEFLDLLQSRTFTVSAMAFQDVWSLDLERVRECCIHVASPDNRLIPFCLYNLTSSEGRNLYRNTIQP
jgi:7,8-dihydro-6-hydroxymethylpterin dimethyltransferase